MILYGKDLDKFIKKAKNSNSTVVFTNGCFDLLHIGHIRFLRYLWLKYNGAVILIGLNTDKSVKKNKGPGRPIISLDERAEMLGAMRYVSAIVPFSEDTPDKIIRRIRPDVLAKGRGYDDKIIVGEQFVRSYKGVIDKGFFIDDYSTTNIVERIRNGLL